MIKKALSLLAILLITTISSSIWTIRPDNFFSSTIFTIAGIMFAVGMGLIVTFNPNGVKNKIYIKELRKNIRHVRDSFLIHIGLLTIYYIANQYVAGEQHELKIHHPIDLSFSYSILFCLLMIYSAIFFVVNFLEIQRLNNDVFDALYKEEI